MNQAFVDAWENAAQGRQTTPEEHLYFENAASLLLVLSNKRLSLLSTLCKSGPSSIRGLSRILLQRSYKNVHTDVTLLRKAGLIRRDEESKVFVPWRKIHTEIDLLTAA